MIFIFSYENDLNVPAGAHSIASNHGLYSSWITNKNEFELYYKLSLTDNDEVVKKELLGVEWSPKHIIYCYLINSETYLLASLKQPENNYVLTAKKVHLLSMLSVSKRNTSEPSFQMLLSLNFSFYMLVYPLKFQMHYKFKYPVLCYKTLCAYIPFYLLLYLVQEIIGAAVF